MKLTTTLIAFMATTATAQDLTPDSFAILLGSNHIGATQDFNESNPGLFLAWRGDIADARIGCYKNSFADTSCAITWRSEHVSVSWGGLEVAPFAGAAYYGEGAEASPIKAGDGNVVPLFGLEITHEALPLFAQWLPGDKEVTGYEHLLTAGLQWDF